VKIYISGKRQSQEIRGRLLFSLKIKVLREAGGRRPASMSEHGKLRSFGPSGGMNSLFGLKNNRAELRCRRKSKNFHGVKNLSWEQILSSPANIPDFNMLAVFWVFWKGVLCPSNNSIII
jgi:hypothetical protein